MPVHRRLWLIWALCGYPQFLNAAFNHPNIIGSVSLATNSVSSKIINSNNPYHDPLETSSNGAQSIFDLSDTNSPLTVESEETQGSVVMEPKGPSEVLIEPSSVKNTSIAARSIRSSPRQLLARDTDSATQNLKSVGNLKEPNAPAGNSTQASTKEKLAQPKDIKPAGLGSENDKVSTSQLVVDLPRAPASTTLELPEIVNLDVSPLASFSPKETGSGDQRYKDELNQQTNQADSTPSVNPRFSNLLAISPAESTAMVPSQDLYSDASAESDESSLASKEGE